MAITQQRVMQCFSAALPTYEQNAIAQKQITEDLLQLLLEKGGNQFQRVLEIGCGTGNFTRLLMQHINAAHWDCNDLCDVTNHLARNLPQKNYRFYQGCGERLDFAHQYDLIASASTIQWFTEPLAFLQRCVGHLTSHGMILFGTFAPTNLHEVRALTGVGLDYPALAQWLETLTSAFSVLHLEQKEIQLKFDSPLSVLKHLKETGVTATNNQSWHYKKIARFCEQYRQQYADEQGKVSLTYVPILMLAQKKEEK